MRRRLYSIIGAVAMCALTALGQGGAASLELADQCKSEPLTRDLREVAERYRSDIERLEKTGAAELSLVEPLARLAVALRDLGEYSQAQQAVERAIAIRERHGRTADLQYAQLWEHLGARHRTAGRNVPAEASYQRCLRAAESALGPESTQYAVCLDYLGVLYGDLGRYAEAESALGRSVTILEQTAPTSEVLAGALSDLGFLYKILGDHGRAEALLKRSLAMREKVHGPCHERVAIALGLLGRLYRESGRPELALPYDRRALEVRTRTRGPDGWATAYSHNYLGLTLARLGRHEDGEAHVRRGLEIRRKFFGDDHREALTSVWHLFQIRQKTGRLLETGPMLEAALRTSAIQQAPELRWRFQDAYRQLLQAQGRSGAAAYFGKEAVNTIQGMRSQLTQLDRDLQQSFLRDKTDAYRGLADLLIEQGRLTEAQQVMAMLKEEEFFDFIRRDGKDDQRSARPAFTGAEQSWVKRHAEIGGRIATLGARRDELARRQKSGLTAVEAAEFKQIDADLEVARKAFVAFIDELVKEMDGLDAKRRADVEARRRDLEGMERYQNDLRALGPGAVMLHYVVLPDKVRIILSTADDQVGYASAISEGELNRKIQAFREALQYPREDPRIVGRELYQALLGPLADALRQSKAQTLILSLDGVLRYIPFAALHDGERYLAQDFRIALVSQASDIRFAAQSGRLDSFAGLGLTHQVPGFDALPAVKEELEGILKSGPVRGEIFLDAAFTAERLKRALEQKVSFLHIASHFVFKPGTETDSFLLLGDGGRLSLRDLRVAGFNFRGVELVTLSACETAVGGGADANGREVEGLGVLAQQRGARAVMATLWPVADASTGVLMQNFYRLRAGQAEVSKAEALRQAQLALLTGQHGKPAMVPGSEAKQRGAARSGRAPRFTPDPKAPYAHPYFWAPFILMGNWL